MRLDSNSLFIARVCGVAVLVLVVWLHWNGLDVTRSTPRCEPSELPPGQTSDCARCQQDMAMSRTTDDVPPVPARGGTAAPRS